MNYSITLYKSGKPMDAHSKYYPFLLAFICFVIGKKHWDGRRFAKELTIALEDPQILYIEKGSLPEVDSSLELLSHNQIIWTVNNRPAEWRINNSIVSELPK